MEVKNLKVIRNEKKTTETEKGESESYITTLQNEEEVTVSIRTPTPVEELLVGYKYNLVLKSDQRTLKDMKERKAKPKKEKSDEEITEELEEIRNE